MGGVDDHDHERPRLDHEFERYSHETDIKHTLSKVGRPQSNGKSERSFQTDDKHRWRCGIPEEFHIFDNEKRQQMGFNGDESGTPVDVFDRWLPPTTDDLDDPPQPS